MDVILDESSLTPCDVWGPSVRIQTLAAALKAFDNLGCARALRSIRSAPDQDIGENRGLRAWCFHSDTDPDSGRFVAQRLGRQPFIDGATGLFTIAEGRRAVEGRARETAVVGLALAALTGAPAVALGSGKLPSSTEIDVNLSVIDIDGDLEETIRVCCTVTEHDVKETSHVITERIDTSVTDGAQLLAQAGDLFPRLRFGPGAIKQITPLSGKELFFHQLQRHLRALDKGAEIWQPGGSYSPADAIAWSRESTTTLDHGKYGPMRDFSMPEGFDALRWSTHTKLTGGTGARLYFHPQRFGDSTIVLIGYFGDHLPTVLFNS